MDWSKTTDQGIKCVRFLVLTLISGAWASLFSKLKKQYQSTLFLTCSVMVLLVVVTVTDSVCKLCHSTNGKARLENMLDGVLKVTAGVLV